MNPSAISKEDHSSVEPTLGESEASARSLGTYQSARPAANAAAKIRKILLVEPSAREAQRLREQLSVAHMEVIWAGDIITAIQMAATQRPCLILAAMRMPTYGGIELMHRLKDDPATSSIPVILHGDHIHSEERARAYDAGARDVVARPYTISELIARVRAVLRARDDLTALELKAHRDGLTGLANRGVFDDQLRRDWDACRRRGQPLTVMLVDLDRFKSVNDTHGHAVGDEVLRRAAYALARCARTSDLAARYGGEELVLVAANCTLETGVRIAQRFQAELAEVVIPVGEIELSVTASVGVATAQYDGTLDSPLELVKRADAALYEAKRNGRNAIWVHDSQRIMKPAGDSRPNTSQAEESQPSH